VVEPEVGEDLFELAVAVDGAQQFAFDEILIDHLHGAVEHLNLRRRSCWSVGMDSMRLILSCGVPVLKQFVFVPGQAAEKRWSPWDRTLRGLVVGIGLLFALVFGDELLDENALFGVCREGHAAIHHRLDNLGRGIALNDFG
jgi:hypothetical protein